MSEQETEQSFRTAEDASSEHSGFASHYDETGQHVISDVQPGAPSGWFSIVAARDNFIVTVDGSGYKIIQEGNRLIIENTLVEQQVVTNGLPQEGEGAGHDHDKLDEPVTQTKEISPNVEDPQSQVEVTPEAHMGPKDGEEDMWQWLHVLDTTQDDIGQSQTVPAHSSLGPTPAQPTTTTNVSEPSFDFTCNEGGGRRYSRDELVALRSKASTRTVDSPTWQSYLETLNTRTSTRTVDSSTWQSYLETLNRRTSTRNAPAESLSPPNNITWRLSYPFLDPRIHRKSYLRNQIHPLDIRARPDADGRLNIPRTLIIASTDPIIHAAASKASNSLIHLDDVCRDRHIDHLAAQIHSKKDADDAQFASESFLSDAAHIIVCPHAFAKDLLSAQVQEVYWLNVGRRDKKYPRGLMRAFERVHEWAEPGAYYGCDGRVRQGG